MASAIGLMRRIWQSANPPAVPKADDALRFGILGAATIAPMAFITPAKDHPEVVVQAVAARDMDRALAYAKKHGIPQALDSYQAILDDPTIDAVYIPLPNGLHLEWALKALKAGKHVLLEKPTTANAKDTATLFDALKQPGAPVLLEAFHYRFQPAWKYFLSLCDGPNVEYVKSEFVIPAVYFGLDDIRFKYDLAGGAVMDLGTYTISALRSVFKAEPVECLESTLTKAKPPGDELCDSRFRAMYQFPNGGIGEIEGDLQCDLLKFYLPPLSVRHRAVVVPDEQLPQDQEKIRVRSLYFKNFIFANLWHYIDIEDTITIRQISDGKVIKTWKTKETKKVYTFQEMGIEQPGKDYWVSYRHQLEQFVNKVRGREGSGLWIDGNDCIAQMKMIDMTYEKGGLPLRPSSKFKPDVD